MNKDKRGIYNKCFYLYILIGIMHACIPECSIKYWLLTVCVVNIFGRVGVDWCSAGREVREERERLKCWHGWYTHEEWRQAYFLVSFFLA